MNGSGTKRLPRFCLFLTGSKMKLIDRIAEDRPLRYAFAGLAILLMFGMVMS
jgi:hypothetical protein